ncbi:NADH-quinone oxidoreductase subunit L [bacterium]|nr:NADH-quinone oxidoreductase subunit L [bacterium]
MSFFAENLYTIILIPFWVSLLFAIGKLFGLIKSKKIVGILTLLSTFYALVFSVGTFVLTIIEKNYILEQTVPFLQLNRFIFDIGIYIDGLSAWMILLVSIVSLLVQIYSYFYMYSDNSFIRFFIFMNLFNASMFGLILSPNMFQIYVFWELVGLCSYLLIGFWYQKNEVSVAAKRAFIINRVGDFSLLSGIILSAYVILTNLNNTLNVSIPFSNISTISAQIYGCTSDGIFILICLLILLGAMAKSAQLPLHTWLIDAMQGPTPVSALIHSATMVAAGVYLIIRLYPLFSLNPIVLQIISVVGITTALVCSYSALTQVDMKKILAYSTNAQLGLMFLAVGACSTTIAMFHLTAHAIIKAMLFLVVGVVAVSLNHNQDIRNAGGLRKQLPICAITFLIGILSLSGILFAGFSSKELIFGDLIDGKHYIYLSLFLIVSFMTAYYLFRMYFYIFEGKNKFDFEIKEPHFVLNLSVSVFALIVILLWFVLPKSNNVLFAMISHLIAAFAVFTAYLTYSQKKLLKKIPILYDLSINAMYFDGVYHFITKSYKRFSKFLYIIDKYIFDGIVYFCTLNTKMISWFLSKIQTGSVQAYLAYSIFILMMSFGGIMLVYSLIMYFSEVQ